MSNIETYFNNHCFDLNRENILDLDKLDNGPIHNVISLLNDYCYGFVMYDDKEFLEFNLFYIDNRNGLSGLMLELSLEIPQNKRTEYTIEFCKVINDKYLDADIIDSYNAFQKQLRTAFEKLGYFTIGNEISMFEGKNGVAILPYSKGLLPFFQIDKKSLYRWLFDEDEKFVVTDESKTKKIYLILDSKNNLIKIGQSFYPKTREKTLHGISPAWDLITTWIAPIQVERDLHKKFSHKRMRGEWFELNFQDLKDIKEFMINYKNCL
jgi:hypothetical protein